VTHTLQYLMKRRMHSAFVGRQEQLAFFRRNLQYKVEDDRRCFVINVSGQGGVGKTWLLRRFEDSAHKFNAVTAWTDEREDDVPGVMGDIAEQFETQGYPLTAFADRYRLYRQGWREIETDPEILSVFSTRLGRGVVKAGLDLARRVLGLTDPDTELVPQEPLVEKGGRFVAFVVRKLKDKDLAHLVLQPVEILTPLFLAGLREVAEKHPLAFFFDAYERTESFLDPWLRALLEGQYGDVPANIFLFVAGRHELDRNDWAPYEGLLARLRLDPFTEEEARAYLGRQGVDDERVVEAILALSGRLPLLVVTLAAESPDDPARVGDPSGTAVERFLKWVADDRRRQVALDAALPRRFDRDVVAVLVGEEEAGALFAWLKSMPFVEKREVEWVYHEVVRAQMLRSKRQESPQGWAGLHGRLAGYYEGLRDGLGLDETAGWRNDDWQGYALEGLYHRLCRSPRGEVAAALNGFVAAWEAGRSFARRWVGVVGQAGEDAGSEMVAGWGRRLREGVEAYEEDRYQETAEMFSALLEQVDLEVPWRAAALVHRGEAYRRMGRYAEALSDLDRAIELKSRDSRAIAVRGEIYRRMGRYEEALADFDRVVELDPDYIGAIASRGETCGQMGRYEEALTDFDRAIELDPDEVSYIAGRGETYRRMGRYEEALTDFDRAIELDPDYIGAIASRGEIYRLMGRYEEALADFDRAIALKPDYDWAIDSRGRTYRRMGRYEEALGWYDKARAIREELGDRAGLATSYNNIGLVHKARGAYDEALGWYEKSLAIQEALGDRAGLAGSYINIGEVHYARGAYEEAVGWFRKSLATSEELGDRAGLATSYNNIGMIHKARGAYEEALGWYEKSLAIQEALGDRAGLAGSYNNIGLVHKARGAYEEALGWYDKALAIREELGDRAGLARSYNNIGAVHHARGAYEAALGWFHKSLAIQEELGDRAGLARSYNNIGMIHKARGAYEAALGWYEKSLAIQEELGDRAGLAGSYNNIGMIYKVRGAYEEAVGWYEKSLAIREALGDRAGLARTLHNVAWVAWAQGELHRALGLFRRSRDLYAALGLSKKVAEKEEMIAQIRAQLSRGQHDIDRGGGY